MNVKRLYDNLLDARAEEEKAYVKFLENPTLVTMKNFAVAVRGTFSAALYLQNAVEKRQQ